MDDWWRIVLAIVLPLIGLVLALRPWIKDIVKADLGEFNERMARIEGQSDAKMARIEGQLDAMERYLKVLIPLYRSITEAGNPSPNKDELLLKLENDTITKEEAIELQRIMEVEQRKAKEQNDTVKAIVIVGILVLIAIFLSKVTK